MRGTKIVSLFNIYILLILSINGIGQTVLPTNSSPAAPAAAPIGWTILTGTTDISDKVNWAGMLPWVGIVDDPPNGHTVWVSGFQNEKVGTTITGLTIGAEYSLTFYMAEITVFDADLLVDGTLKITIDGSTFLYPFAGGFDNSWSTETLTFTATSESMLMAFEYEIMIGNFWNISFASDVVDALCEELITEVSEIEICLDEEVTLSATSVTGGTITWDGGVEDGAPFTPPVGTTTYTATSDSEDDCDFSVDITVHDPEVTASVDEDIICLGESVVFTGGGADTYDWDMGVTDGVSFEPPSVGIEIYTVTGTDEFGCENTASVDVVVTPNAIADFEFVINGASSEDGLTGGCLESTVQFNDLSTIGDPGTIVDWDWNFGDGGSSALENPTHLYGSAGIYTITLTVTTAGGCTSTYTLDIIMTNGLSIDLLINEPTCYGFSDGSITVNVAGGGDDLTFIITDSDGNEVNEANSNTANTLNKGWYYFDVSDGSSCDAIDSVFLDEPGELDIDITVTDPLCFGFKTGWARVDSVYNTTGDYDGVSYIWNPNPAGVGGEGADSTYNMGAGDYTLTINDDNGCSRVFDFEVNQPDSLYFSEFGFEPAYCRLHEYQSGNGVVFGAASGGTPDFDYLWTNVATGETINNTTWGGRNPGNYKLTVIDANGCILERTVFLDSLNPIADFSVISDQLNGDLKGTAPVEVSFGNLSQNFANPFNPTADTTFFWNLDRPTADWQVSHDYFEVLDTTYTAKGQTYTVDVCLVALNKNGCTDTACKVITIYEPIVFTQINIFTPNGDGINDVFSFDFRASSISAFSCIIVNRWGIVVFEMDDISDAWNGRDKSGNQCNDGTYFYAYSATADDGTRLSGQGNVSIVDSK